MLHFFIFVAGLLLGSFITWKYFNKKAIGYLRVDRSDPTESHYLFLELNNDVENITDKKQVMLIVKKENYISQK